MQYADFSPMHITTTAKPTLWSANFSKNGWHVTIVAEATDRHYPLVSCYPPLLQNRQRLHALWGVNVDTLDSICATLPARPGGPNEKSYTKPPMK